MKEYPLTQPGTVFPRVGCTRRTQPARKTTRLCSTALASRCLRLFITKAGARPSMRRALIDGGDMVIAATECSLERPPCGCSTGPDYAAFASSPRCARVTRPADAPRPFDNQSQARAWDALLRAPTVRGSAMQSPTFGWGGARPNIVPLKDSLTGTLELWPGGVGIAGLTSGFRSSGFSGVVSDSVRPARDGTRLSATACA